MKEILAKIQREALKALQTIKNSKDLQELEILFFGRKGKITTALKGLKDVSADARREMGAHANTVKQEIAAAFDHKRQTIEESRFDVLKDNEWIDITEPMLPHRPRGSMHPVTQVGYELEELFRSLGFKVLSGPEVESDYYNFEALNIPVWHPARESMDTFYIEGHDNWVMRTHTSPMQVRAMQQYGAPLRAIVPGRVFRNEATDASHEHTFYQVEGLMIDKDISIAHLIAVMKELLRGIFKRDVAIRLRPGHFQFVEPGFELDIKCLICGGTGCSVCKHNGWVELLPCGMVHPRVLEHGGIDPAHFSGFAFGLGWDRLVMMRYGIEDIRHIHGGNMKFLTQF